MQENLCFTFWYIKILASLVEVLLIAVFSVLHCNILCHCHQTALQSCTHARPFRVQSFSATSLHNFFVDSESFEIFASFFLRFRDKNNSHQRLQSLRQVWVSPAPAQISQNFYRAAKSFKLRISRKNKNCSIPVSIVYAVVEKKVLASRWESDVFDYGQDNVRSKEACRCLVSSRSQTKFLRDDIGFDSSLSSR